METPPRGVKKRIIMKNASIVLFGDSYAAGRLAGTQTDGALKKHLKRVIIARM